MKTVHSTNSSSTAARSRRGLVAMLGKQIRDIQYKIYRIQAECPHDFKKIAEYGVDAGADVMPIMGGSIYKCTLCDKQEYDYE